MNGLDIRHARRELGIPAGRFAQVLGVHPTTLSRWEHSSAPVCEGIAGDVLKALVLRVRMLASPRGRTVMKRLGQDILVTLSSQGTVAAFADLAAFAAGMRSVKP